MSAYILNGRFYLCTSYACRNAGSLGASCSPFIMVLKCPRLLQSDAGVDRRGRWRRLAVVGLVHRLVGVTAL